MSHKVVVFTENNARILINPEHIELYADMPNAVIDPDLSGVVKVPPHLWKLQDGKIVKMGLRESINRIKHIDANGANNDLGSLPAPPPEPVIVPVVIEVKKSIKPLLIKISLYLLAAAMGSAITILVQRL